MASRQTWLLIFWLVIGGFNLHADLQIIPPAANLTNQATLTFNASGGLPPYAFALVTNNSGGSITATGFYTAGPVPLMDGVRVTDALGSNAVAVIQVAVVVPSTATPYLAGMPDGTASSLGAPEPPDAAPRYSPVMVPGIPLSTNTALSFSVAGGMLHYPPGPGEPFDPLDGRSSRVIRHRSGAEHGISDLHMPIDALLGVFLGNEPPDFTPAPYPLNFSTPALRDYDLLRPQLKQVFFLGDGTGSGGIRQHVIPPPDATRLFLGASDAYGWANNRGGFTVGLSLSNLIPPFAISPTAVQVFPGGSTKFSASGGVPPYTFALVTNHSGGALTNDGYTAGEWPETDTIRATDALGSNALASVIVMEILPVVDLTPSDVAEPALVWGASAAEFVLESTESLKSPVVWTEVTNLPAGEGAAMRYSVTNEPARPARFYRLRRAVPLDTDLDGLPDAVELTLLLNPRNASTLNDGTWDGNRDSDGDGLRNRWEYTRGLNPGAADSNGDGLADGAEDPDSDTLSNTQEQIRGTNPLKADSDGDGWPDPVEIEVNSNSSSAASRPNVFITATPPVRMVLPRLSGSGVPPLNTIVAQPPAAVVLPRRIDATTLSWNTTVAPPPLAVVLPRLGDGNLFPLNTTLGQPPVRVEWGQP